MPGEDRSPGEDRAPSRTAQAFWITGPGVGELRPVPVGEVGADDVLVRALYSGVSRGTESLVLRGAVPPSQYAQMRAPYQVGDFPWPVKYGYLNVGVVETGPPDLAGRTVFCLYPHQTHYVVPALAVTVVPDAVPAPRAVLAGTVETAVNAIWDAAPLIGDRICVIGAGMVGACVAAVLARFPGVRVQLVDTLPERSTVAAALGVDFALPADAEGDCDLVVHAGAGPDGLARSLELLAPEGTVIELSWYGDRSVTLPLGENFHSRRLTVRSSQVGTISPNRAARGSRRGFADRLALALELLVDPRFDVLLAPPCDFALLPQVLPRFVAGQLPGLCQLVAYPSGPGEAPRSDP